MIAIHPRSHFRAGLGEDGTRDLDAAEFTGQPVAAVSLPQQVPFGFHGSWIPDVA